MIANTIDDVLTTLSAIVADNKHRRDTLGYFPALYRQVTLRVKDGIDQGLFDNGPRMSRFDAAFANAYFTAYTHYRHNQQTSRAWQFAFDCTASGQLIILQDLLLAINAHINLDLGVVTGSTFAPTQLDGFKNDFDRINAILAALIPLARKAIDEFSPGLAELDKVVDAPGAAEALEFSVETARDEAWRAAEVVAFLPMQARPLSILGIDSTAKLLARVVADPPEPAGSVVHHVRAVESNDVAAVINALDNLA